MSSVSKFYDSYGLNDFKKGCNERHLFLHKKLMSYGLNSKSNILELGCGAGIITTLIAQTVRDGKIVSSDISPESIEISKRNNLQRNIEFNVSDIVEFKHSGFKLNFITLFDVLEHVPKEEHLNIFKNIRSMMDEGTKLLIHVPTSENIIHSQTACPEKLQIIDQPLSVLDIVEKASNSGLRLEHMELSNIWNEYDYQLYVFGIPKSYKDNPFPIKKKSISNKIKNRIFKK